MPNAQTAARIAKRMPAQRALRPRSRAYIAPPIIVPFSLLTRYLIAINVSAYFVAMPKIPVSHIQRTEPGPPMAIAVPTPMMLPVPIVEESAVVSAPNCDTSPSASGSRVTESLIALKISFWMNPVRIVMKICVPNRRMISGHPHRKLSSLLINAAIFPLPAFEAAPPEADAGAPKSNLYTSIHHRVKAVKRKIATAAEFENIGGRRQSIFIQLTKEYQRSSASLYSGSLSPFSDAMLR